MSQMITQNFTVLSEYNVKWKVHRNFWTAYVKNSYTSFPIHIWYIKKWLFFVISEHICVRKMSSISMTLVYKHTNIETTCTAFSLTLFSRYIERILKKMFVYWNYREQTYSAQPTWPARTHAHTRHARQIIGTQTVSAGHCSPHIHTRTSHLITLLHRQQHNHQLSCLTSLHNWNHLPCTWLTVFVCMYISVQSLQLVMGN